MFYFHDPVPMVQICTLKKYTDVQPFYFTKGYAVININTGKLKAVNASNKGYPYVSLQTITGKVKKVLVHQLMYFAYINDELYEYPQVLEHLNDIKFDYNLDNIMLSTQFENMKRMFVNGHPNRIDKIFEIEMHDGQILRGTMKELQDMTGISRMTIYDRFYNQRPGRKIKNVRLIG